jgi:putative ABC transport system substrate-binding protein
MQRRVFIAGLGGAAAWPLVARAQVPSKRRPLIVWLSGGTQQMGTTFTGSFLQGLKDLGYVEGRNLDVVYRYSDGYQDKLPALAEEVVLLRPDVILAAAVITAVAAKNKTSTIPIVCPALADPVHLGLMASDARPGGNVTGIEPYVTGLPAKQMELAREIVPGSSKIGILTDLTDPKAPPQLRELEYASRALGIEIATAGVRRPEEIDTALQTLANQQLELVIVLQTSMLLTERQKIADVTLAKRLPTVYGYREHVLAGGLVSYGVDLRWCYYRGAYFVDKILHGTAPGDIPVEFPTKLLLAVNAKTANKLGIGLPPTLLARADEVIE